MKETTTPNLGERELDQATREGRLILFHMRFNAGYPLSTPFSQAVKQDNNGTLAKIDARDPFIVEFHSVEEFKRAEDIIRAADPSALEKSWVWYEHQVRPFSRFRIDTREAMHALYEDLLNDQTHNSGASDQLVRTGFPRIINWKASKQTLQEEASHNRFRGNGNLIGGHDFGPTHYLYQTVNVNRSASRWKDFMEATGEAEILAFPYVLVPYERLCMNERRLSQPGPYVSDVYWDLQDESQLSSVIARDGGQPRLL
ncbi:MAG: hypothetical protein AB7E85_00645 [Pseudobdellovibrionaceae bacterium]